MQEFEKLGVFYIGRRFDPATRQPTGEVVLYDSRDLVTHALCVGMTGSGKTGLGVAVIEEAAIDGVPAIVIDPKGDLTNLLLTFPQLQPADFLPWVNEDDARRGAMERDAYAAEQADVWRAGLAEWGQDGGRIARLRDAAEFTIYTPGSTAGVPVSVFSSFARPDTGDAEMLRERVQTAVSSLLALADIDAEPFKSREHILLSTILLAAWQAGESPDLALLLQRIQQPPITRIGVMDVESFFPAKERFALAMSINALLASPGFDIWSQGEPLDVGAFLRAPGGKPRVSIFSIAHLDDSQRMFFVALLLNAVAGWMRAQTGTSSLRALVYMDEIFGFFPPVANPPSKGPLLTLLKQGRAAGVGVVLATQNPVDLDYKGLSNIGTWWLGRLQTERDKARVLDGLEGAHESGGFDRGEIDRLLSALTSRVFLMRNVHEDALTLFESRWALSYLRGPLGRDEIKRLTAARPASGGAAAPPSRNEPAPVAHHGAVPGSARPVIPPGVPEYFAPDAAAVGSPLEPALYGAAEVRFVDPRLKVDLSRLVTVRGPIAADPAPVDWRTAAHVDWAPEMLERDQPDGALFADLPAAALKAKSYEKWAKQLAAALAITQSLTLLRSRSTGEVSRPDESERDFRARLQQASREARDRALDTLGRKYAPRQAALDEKLRRAQQAVGREAEQASGQKLQTAISVGATLVGALFGRKAINVGTIGRATTAARGVGRSMKESEDIERAKQNLAAVEDQRRALDDDLRAETASIDAAHDVATEPLETLTIKPKKANVTVKLVALVWTLPADR
ncbi:MAG: ATP-binding protein [Luteitalea sp.]|nr:ATP-binding protein [Luteitalea sp.]